MSLLSTAEQDGHLSSEGGLKFWSGFKAFLAKRAEQNRIFTELSSMSDRDLSDLGVNRSDILDIAKGNWRKS